MANAIYDKYRERLLGAQTNSSLTAGTVKCALVDTGTYTFSQAHEFLSSLSGVVGTAQTLASKTVVNGVFDAADILYAGLTGASTEALVFYIDTGVAGTSPLVAFLDTGFTGLPFTPSGSDVNVIWSASGIFKL